MEVEFQDLQENGSPWNGKTFDSADELQKALDQIRQREPSGLELISKKGAALTVLLAQAYGSVQHTADESGHRYFVAVASDAPQIFDHETRNPYALACEADLRNGIESPEFLVGGTPTPVPTRYILPYEKIKEIAVYFLETGKRNPNVSWEMI